MGCDPKVSHCHASPRQSLLRALRVSLRILKRIVPQTVKTWVQYVQRFGLGQGVQLHALLRRRAHGDGLVMAVVPALPHPLWLRPRTSDVLAFEQTFIVKEYDVNSDVVPQVVIDAGANCGTTSVWFASKYPNSIVVAVEPDEANYEVLKRNIAPYENIVAMRKGLWGRPCMLSIINPTAAPWSFEVREDPAGSICGTTIEEILSNIGCSRADVVKLDIEGSEKEVLEQAGTWIGGTFLLFVELHDRKRAGCGRALTNAVGGEFVWDKKGEKVVLMRRR